MLDIPVHKASLRFPELFQREKRFHCVLWAGTKKHAGKYNVLI